MAHTEASKLKISLAKTGKPHPHKGHVITQEIREKISNGNKGKVPWNKGKKHKPESLVKMSLAKKGKQLTEEHKKKIGIKVAGKNNPIFGKPRSEETKNKIRLKLSGEKSLCWRGGISREPYCQVWTKDLKQFIKDRDGNQCLNPQCRKNSLKLCIHHINYNKKDCDSVNLITLCYSCNSIANHDREYWQGLYNNLIKDLYYR